jgi:hypothetical protein
LKKKESEREHWLIGEHLFQQPEFIEENKKCTSKQMRALVDIDERLFQQPEFKEDKKKWCAKRKQ